MTTPRFTPHTVTPAGERIVRGQCFLCERVTRLIPPAPDPPGAARPLGSRGYTCPHCGGVNDPFRINLGLDHQRRPLPPDA